MAFKKNNITVLIAARMGSSRFPGKTLMDLHGKPMLERQIERIKDSRHIDNIIVATTIRKEDSKIEEWCNCFNIGCFRGSDTDVLGRLLGATERFNISTIVEILGDNPLIDASLIDSAIELFFENTLDYVATLTDEYPKADLALNRFPLGVRVQVFSKNTIEICSRLANSVKYREHATSFIAENPNIFKTDYITAKDKFELYNFPDLTFAVNVPANLELIRNIFKECYDKNPCFSVSDAIKVFHLHPKWGLLMGNNA